jgi:hypothetical protein
MNTIIKLGVRFQLSYYQLLQNYSIPWNLAGRSFITRNDLDYINPAKGSRTPWLGFLDTIIHFYTAVQMSKYQLLNQDPVP